MFQGWKPPESVAVFKLFGIKIGEFEIYSIEKPAEQIQTPRTIVHQPRIQKQVREQPIETPATPVKKIVYDGPPETMAKGVTGRITHF